MDSTILSANLLLSEDWVFIPLDEDNVVKVTCLTKPAKVNDISIRGRYEIGQFDNNGNGYNLRQVRWEDFSLFHKLPLPEFFDYQYLGIRVAPDFEPFTVKIEGLKMSVNTSGSRAIAKLMTSTAQIGNTAVKAVTARPDRIGLVIRNSTKGNIWIDFGEDVNPVVNDYLEKIPSGGVYESNSTYNGDVWIIGDLATAEGIIIREIIQ